MPEGKPTKELAEQLYEFAKHIYENTIKLCRVCLDKRRYFDIAQ